MKTVFKVTKRKIENEIIFCRKTGYEYLVKYSYSDTMQGLYHIHCKEDLLGLLQEFTEKNLFAKVEIFNVNETYKQMK